MLKLNLRQLATIGIFVMLALSSFFASMWYHKYKDVVLEKERWDNINRNGSELPILAVFRGYVKESFSKDTSADPEEWSETNSTYGQCAVAALVVQGFFGGEILRAEIPEKWQDAIGFSTHYWNRIAGRDVDFTREQFPPQFPYDDLISEQLGHIKMVDREDMLSDEDVAARYRTIMKRLEKILF